MGKQVLCFSRFFFVLIAFLFTTFLTQPALAQEDFPKLKLPKVTRGAAAIQALGPNITRVARAYGKSKGELTKLLRQDKDLLVDKSARLAYTCRPLAGKAQGESMISGNTVTALAAPFPLDQTFALHSRPTANKRLYLDFNGHVASNTAWSSSPINAAPFDLDGLPSTFNDLERERIQYIWQRVAEDYAPFELDVTTQDPLIPESQYGMRVVITPTNFYPNAGGVAYVGVFGTSNAGYYAPAWVFSNMLGNGNEKYVAEAISHEAGHTLGLSHDGTTAGVEYYQGQGDWAPIMGNSYYKAVSQFSKGEYANANNKQDDLAIIAGKAPYREDEPARAFSSTAFIASGVLTQAADADTFTVDAGSGPVDIQISTPDSRASNVNIKAKLLNEAGQVVLLSDPSTALSASIVGTVAQGKYTIRLDGVGSGDPISTGYSDYDSLGQYLVSGSVSPVSGGTPVALVAANPVSGIAPLTVSFSGSGSYDPDGSIVSYQWNFGDGTTGTGVLVDHVYTVDGTFNATLTVVDDSGLSATATTSIVVALPPNQLPVASITPNSSTTGMAPLAVSLSGASSYDPDGSIVSYVWAFGDGSTSTGSASVTHSYTAARSYTATLTVTDNRGATASASIAITVTPDPSLVMFVSDIAMSVLTNGSMKAAQAQVAIKNSSGTPISGATVTVQWTGVFKATQSITTNAYGVATFASKYARKSGTYTVKVNAVSAAAYTYDATKNVKSTASIVVP